MEDCQQLCQKTSGCHSFSYLTSNYDGSYGRALRKNCILQNTHEQHLNYDSADDIISGPKYCPGKTSWDPSRGARNPAFTQVFRTNHAHKCLKYIITSDATLIYHAITQFSYPKSRFHALKYVQYRHHTFPLRSSNMKYDLNA